MTKSAARLRDAAQQPGLSARALRFVNREFLIITYRTDPERCARWCPSRSRSGATVKYEFIRMPDSTGFGDYTETGQVIPVRFEADGTVQKAATCTPCTWTTTRRSPAAANCGASRRSSPSPKLCDENDTLVGTLRLRPGAVRTATMGYKHRALDPAPLLKSLARPTSC